MYFFLIFLSTFLKYLLQDGGQVFISQILMHAAVYYNLFVRFMRCHCNVSIISFFYTIQPLKCAIKFNSVSFLFQVSKDDNRKW